MPISTRSLPERPADPQESPSIQFTDMLPPDFAQRSLRRDVLDGLVGLPKRLPPTWLYDAVGSELFEQITLLPEYYPTRCERQILHAHAAEAVQLAGADTIVELGSGSSLKTHLLLDALTATTRARGDTATYIALDVSEEALRQACGRLAQRYTRLSLHAVRADFTHQDGLRPLSQARAARRLVAFLGGTIGNLEPVPRAAFLATLRQSLSPGDHLLLGADLVKSPEILLPAYDDAAGVTAQFDLNVLQVLNRELDGDFCRSLFRHRAVWDPHTEWIEMRLRAVRAHDVHLRRLGLRIPFAKGEELRTEVSAKFRRERLQAELAIAGFEPVRWWTDPAGMFSLSLWAAA